MRYSTNRLILTGFSALHIYDEQIAGHYAAYRPPLHQLIVGEVLGDRQFSRGLDVGCGTGYSTIALVDHCDHVIGVDQSQSHAGPGRQSIRMWNIDLARARKLPVADGSIDLVTFAGVLFYLDAGKTIAELSRICRGDALIVPYDFEVRIDALMQLFDLPTVAGNDDYDHACNLTATAKISTLKQENRTVEIDASCEEAAHILLSDKARHTPLAELYGTPDPFDRVVDRLRALNWGGRLKAEIYYSLHQLIS